MFPGEVPATRDVMVAKEASSFADALLVREPVDADTVPEMLRHPGKDESEQTLENMKWIEEHNIAFKTNRTKTVWSMHFGGRNRWRKKRPWVDKNHEVRGMRNHFHQAATKARKKETNALFRSSICGKHQCPGRCSSSTRTRTIFRCVRRPQIFSGPSAGVGRASLDRACFALVALHRSKPRAA
jgi:hypothetical protein